MPKNYVFFSSIARITWTPQPPIQTTWSSFLDVKIHFARMTEKGNEEKYILFVQEKLTLFIEINYSFN